LTLALDALKYGIAAQSDDNTQALANCRSAPWFGVFDFRQRPVMCSIEKAPKDTICIWSFLHDLPQ
jgi:hypothetical protein